MTNISNKTGNENMQEVLDVLHKYAWSFDSNDLELMGSVFSEHAKTGGVVTGTDIGWGPWVGRGEIVTNLGAIRASQTDRRRHMLTTPIFLKSSDTEARVKIYLALFSSSNGETPELVTTGEYAAELSKVNGKWQIDLLEAALDSPF